jgi:Family of unknown function (DUF5335)
MVELAERDWDGYLRVLTIDATGAPASVQMVAAGPDSGAAPCTALRPLRGIGYARERDALEVAVGGSALEGPSLRCFVSAPRRVLTEQRGGELSIHVVRASGERALVRIMRAAR